MAEKWVMNIFSLILTLVLLTLLASSGAAQPQLTITSFCDITHESCHDQEEALVLLEEKYPHDITVDFVYYFDTENVQSALAHIALECAQRQGVKDAYKQEIQNNRQDISRSSLKKYAEQIVISPENFSFCLDTQASAWDVLDHINSAEDAGVTMEPSVQFNADIYTGVQTFTSLHARTQEYLFDSSLSAPITIENEEKKQEEKKEEKEKISKSSFIVETEKQDGDGDKESSSESEHTSFSIPLDYSEEPLFYRGIRGIRNWMLSLFS